MVVVTLESQIILPALAGKQMPTINQCESRLIKQDRPYSTTVSMISFKEHGTELLLKFIC